MYIFVCSIWTWRLCGVTPTITLATEFENRWNSDFKTLLWKNLIAIPVHRNKKIAEREKKFLQSAIPDYQWRGNVVFLKKECVKMKGSGNWTIMTPWKWCYRAHKALSIWEYWGNKYCQYLISVLLYISFSFKIGWK